MNGPSRSRQDPEVTPETGKTRRRPRAVADSRGIRRHAVAPDVVLEGADAQLQDGSTTEDLSSDLNSFDLAADFGFGLMVPLGRPTLTFEIRYEQSILNLAGADRQEGDDVLPVRFRSTGFQFMAGLLWPLGGK